MEMKNINLPLIALRGMTVLPDMVIHFDISRKKSIHAVEKAMEKDQKIFLATQVDPEVSDPEYEDLYHVGTLVKIKQLIKLPNSVVRVLVEGVKKGTLEGVTQADGMLVAEVAVNEQPPQELDPTLNKAMLTGLRELIRQYALANPRMSRDILKQWLGMNSARKLLERFTIDYPMEYRERQHMLELDSLEEMYEYAGKLLIEDTNVSRIKEELSEKVKEKVDKHQKEYILREQLKVLNEELDGEDDGSEIEEFCAAVKELEAAAEIKEKIRKEIKRYKILSQGSAEANVERGYIETLLEMPWDKMSEDNRDLDAAAQVLDEDHYGMKKIKERILESLAVRNITSKGDAPILCLVGPPGTGKTSIARSVAKALNKKYVRICLGGVRDEAEIRGHRKTYVGAMPGRIITAFKAAGVKNPLMLLDEIDKISSDYKGDTASALLEVLDPEQNNSFSDHFIEFPFDLSHVFWIVTANAVDTIPPALLDRLEIIQLSSYTDEEKVKIAQLHLLPKELKLNGLEKYKVSVSEKAIRRVIHDYTREAGVRNLERKLAGICRKVAFKIVKGKSKGAQVTEKNLEKYLGPVIYLDDDISLKSSVGVANGLAWTSVGGELLKVEVLAFKGKGNLTLTGQLGDVMKESAQAGYTYIRSRAEALGIAANFGETMDIHIHLPEGAVPKDGPSAGVTMVTAMVSALTGKKVKGKLAMTGEISLSGKVWPVGGIKEKMLAAYRYGVKTVLLPKRNMQDLDELPENIRKEMQFIPVEHLDDVLKLALEDKNE